METVHLPGDQPAITTSETASPTLDMDPAARLTRIREVQGRLAAGEAVSVDEINPKTHSPELVALVQQQRRRGIGVEL